MALPPVPDPSEWGWWTWALHGVGTLYVLGFVAFYFRFRAGERRARAEGGDAVFHYNRMLRGFPNAFYAKMLGRRRLEVKPVEPSEPPKPPSQSA